MPSRGQRYSLREAVADSRSMLEPVLRVAIPALWVAWLLYWARSARDVKPTRWRESRASQALHRVPLGLCLILLAMPQGLPAILTERVLPPGPVFPIAGAVMVPAGLGLAVWARRHLGQNWSANVTVKEGHALIRTGPYRRLRHPIYSGILVAMAGTAMAIGEWRGVVAVVLALTAFIHKSRLEEDRMRMAFPEYELYRSETAALIPFVF
jgi:protein-S-isoprenylcysteine O-methyltransferase Ste14